MDIEGSTFYQTLPDILNDVGEAFFVALDLELSGVPIKQTRLPGQSSGKQTLQQRYNEVKAAAEKYQVLQIGLTFVINDLETGKYVCKPYNIPISPLVPDSALDIERSITFSSGAATFLRSVYFDFSKPFNDGVTYLTEQEIHMATERFDARQKRAAKTTLDVKESDVEAHAYLESTRKAVKAWLSSTAKHKDDFVNVGPPSYDIPGTEQQPEMTKYQKWLVHQLVQVEFPELRTISKRGFIQIMHHDARVEARRLAERQAEFKMGMARQKGFGWIVDALLGADIDHELLARCMYETMPDADSDLQRVQRDTKTACDRLRRQPCAIVGHNCFLDLVYIYHTFIGSLPDSVRDFADNLHQRFPLVIDTKYLATHNCGDIPPHSSLNELARRFEPKDDGAIVNELASGHDKYENTDFDFSHEAGFDSLLTAQVAIRLSRQLEAAGRYVEELDDGGVTLSKPATTRTSVVSKVVDKGVNAVSATLSSLGLHTGEKPSAPAGKMLSAPESALASPQTTDTQRQNKSSLNQTLQGGVPGLGSDFWRVYGNHLRVFGTQEGVLALDAVES